MKSRSVGKMDLAIWVTTLHVISVIQLHFHMLYIPEFDTSKRRDLCTFITHFQVILFTRAVSLHELRFFSKTNKYLYLLSQSLFFVLCECFHSPANNLEAWILKTLRFLGNTEWKISIRSVKLTMSDEWLCLSGIVWDQCGEEGAEVEGKALNVQFHLPSGYSHNLERMRSGIRAAEVCVCVCVLFWQQTMFILTQTPLQEIRSC